MGALISKHNWNDTPLGSIDTWPASLKVLLSTSLKAAVPMVLMWGDDLTFFYNDAYRPILGNEGKHPSVLGTKAENVWPEGWAHVKPLLDQVYTLGASVTFQDTLVPVYRDGKMQDVYWSFGYSPARDEDGNIRGIFIVCDETTQRVTKLHNVVERTGSPIVIYKGEELIIEEINQAALDQWQVRREDIVGKPFTEALPEMKDQSFPELLLNVYRTGETYYGYEVPTHFRRSNGEIETVYYNFEYSPYKEANGNTSGVIGVAIDVTKSVVAGKATEAALLESEQRFRTTFECAAVGIAELALDGTWRLINDRLCSIVGYSREELLSRTFQDITHPDDLDEDLWYVQQLLEGAMNSYVLKKRYLHRDGSTVWINLTCSVVRDAAGKPRHFVSVIEDITQQQEAEERLRASERKLRDSEASFRQLADAMPQLVWVAEVDGHTSYYNSRVSEFAGARMQEDGSWLWQGMMHPEDLDRTDKAWTQAIATGQDYVVEHRVKMADGQYRWFLSRAYPFRDENGKVLKWFGTATNIDDQKKQEHVLEQKVAERTKELEQLNRALALSNQELEQFAYVASHDLQEPLRKIKAFGDMLANNYKEQLGTSGADLVGRMQNASTRMSTLIEDVLSFSRISSRKEAPELVDTTLVLKETIQDLETAIFEKNAMIVQEPLQPIVGSKHQMRQLFQNLLSNALKFSKGDVQPVISITSKVVAGKDAGFKNQQPRPDEMYQLIEVKDNGIGFEPQYAGKIFQIFQRLHGRSEYEGSGVGLAIVQKVVMNHGGMIEAESSAGEGALFRMLFPLAQKNT